MFLTFFFWELQTGTPQLCHSWPSSLPLISMCCISWPYFCALPKGGYDANEVIQLQLLWGDYINQPISGTYLIVCPLCSKLRVDIMCPYPASSCSFPCSLADAAMIAVLWIFVTGPPHFHILNLNQRQKVSPSGVLVNLLGHRGFTIINGIIVFRKVFWRSLLAPSILWRLRKKPSSVIKSLLDAQSSGTSLWNLPPSRTLGNKLCL